MNMAAAAKIQAIHRYPVKGLSPEPLPRTELTPGRTVPSTGSTPSRTARPASTPPTRLFAEAALPDADAERPAGRAAHRVRRSEPRADIHRRDREAARGDLRTPEGRAAIERFFADFCADELRGPPKVLHAEGHSFSDVAQKVVSIINLASVAALEDATGAPVHPLRFRGNLQVEGWPAWHEFDLSTGRSRSARARG